jgi:hypothetical protein
MNREDIISMAREAGKDISQEHGLVPFLERFATLVAAAEREGMAINSIHTCHAECQRPICVLVREAVAVEREECAVLVEQMGIEGYGTLAIAVAIRRRGQE